jgi:protein phosphatase 1 regulatory subunit 7
MAMEAEDEADTAAAGYPAEPLPGDGPSERRARVELPPPMEDEGPTYYRIGIDHTFSPGDEEIHFQCTRIKKLENLEPAGASLKRLILVANCIEKIQNLEALVNLEHLELYQNLLKRIENIAHLKHLNILDLSFNKIRSIEYLGTCPFEKLSKLYLSSNKIDMIEGIFHFGELSMLELGSNRIRDVPQQLEQLRNLQELWLGKNKIASMALAPLPNLRHLSLQNNRLELWDAALFRNCPNLMCLYLGHNNLPDLPDEFALLTELKEVDLAKNAITHIRAFREMGKLQELWMNDNQVADLAEVRNLSQFPALRTVYLERNPMHGLGDKDKEATYKDAILAAVPGLRQLDAVHLGDKVTLVTDGTEKSVIGIRKR